ncbi:ABC-2 family transporter protein [Peptococcaceae bacterium CEB3]|nr:ABC-2 family transporter protein [Peptococcaceae bacterium CEB3]
MLRSELYRAFHRKWTLIAFALGLLVVVIGYIAVQVGPLSFGVSLHEYNAWYVFLQVFGMNFNSIWGLTVPLLAALPFGDTLIYDMNHGFEVPLLMRIGKRRYFLTKWLANIIVIACVFGAVLSCSLLLALLWRRDTVLPVVLPPLIGDHIPSGLKPGIGVFASSYQPHVLSGLFWAHPGLYSLLALLIGILVTISIGSLTIGASFWFKNRYLILSTPFIFYMVLNVVLQFLGLYLWVPFLMAAGYLNAHNSIGSTVAYWSVILLFSLILVPLGATRYGKSEFTAKVSIDEKEG